MLIGEVSGVRGSVLACCVTMTPWGWSPPPGAPRVVTASTPPTSGGSSTSRVCGRWGCRSRIQTGTDEPESHRPLSWETSSGTPPADRRRTELLAKLERVDDAGPTLWDDVAARRRSAARPRLRVGGPPATGRPVPGPEAALPVAALVEARWRRRTQCGGGAAVVAGACRSGTSRTRRRARLGVGRDPSARHRRDRVGSDTRGDRTPQTGARRSGHLDPRAGRTVPGLPRRHRGLPTLMTMIVDGRSDVEAAESAGRLARAPRSRTTSPGWCTTRSTTSDDPPTRLRITQALGRGFPAKPPGDPRPASSPTRTGRCRDRCGDPGSARPRQRATSTSALTAPRRAVRR